MFQEDLPEPEIDRLLGLGQRGAGPDADQNIQPERLVGDATLQSRWTARHLGLHRERDPDLGRELHDVSSERRLGDTDDRVGKVVDADRRAHHVGRSVQPALPERMADDRDRIRTRSPVILEPQQAPQDWPHAEQGKVRS